MTRKWCYLSTYLPACLPVCLFVWLVTCWKGNRRVNPWKLSLTHCNASEENDCKENGMKIITVKCVISDATPTPTPHAHPHAHPPPSPRRYNYEKKICSERVLTSYLSIFSSIPPSFTLMQNTDILKKKKSHTKRYSWLQGVIIT